MSRVYVSLPLTGPVARLGRAVLRGAELASEQRGGELVALDSFAADRDAQAAVNARAAIADPGAVAYIGDFHSSQVLATAPLLAQAGLLAIAPVATFAGLAGDTLVRLAPHDGVGAQAIAAWLEEAGVRELLVVHDHDRDYGVSVGTMCAEAARARGLGVRARPIWDHDEPWRDDVRGAQAFLYVGVAGSGAVGLWRDLHSFDPSLWLLGSEGVAEPWLAAQLSAGAAERTRCFVAYRASFEFYGYEAMALALDAGAAGGRADAVAYARGVRDRDSLLGSYSIDPDGHTTSTACGRLAVVDGALVWDSGAARRHPG